MNAVVQLQKEILECPQLELPTEHIFHGGMYCRQVWQPEGVVVVGKVHKKEHFFMVVQGSVAVTEGDESAKVMNAPFLLCSKPGTKRAILALTDTLYMTIHRADSDTVEAVEDELVLPEPNCPFIAGNKLKVIA
jgi:hypothetical protein